jgi:uncharacterized protein
VFWILLLLPQSLLALEVPQLSGRVNDYGFMLSAATVQQLEGSLQAFEANQSTQIVVLTIPSLEGEVLEEFSIRVAEQWKIGHEGLDNGAILIIAKSERKLRIEVGYGLEGTLTDLRSGRIIRDIIVPQFKQGNFDQGVINGVSAMMSVVRGEFSAADAPPRTGNSDETEGLLVMLIATLFFIGKAFGRNKVLAAGIGGVAAPVLGLFILGAKWLMILALIPAGIVGAFIASVFAASARSGRRSSYHRGSGGIGGFGGSSGGFGGGGFSGGGGGFGGGGASGGW